VANSVADDRASRRIEENLKGLRAEYASLEGKPFNHFFCPILLQDEEVPLCMGHIVNDAIPNSFGGCIVQRKDVDNWYGALAEADFTTHIQARSMTPDAILRDSSMRRKLSPTIVIGGEALPHYEDQGTEVPGHTPITIHFGKDGKLNWVVKKRPDDIDALDGRNFEVRLGKDYRLAAFVSLIKAGYLTLFKLLGYSYAILAAGIEIGHNLLGNFYTDHRHQKPGEAIKKAATFFRTYVNMMRPIERFTGDAPRGTVEDGLAHVCVTPGRAFFALIVWIRTDNRYHAVMLPAFNEPNGTVAYHNFLHNNEQSLRVQSCRIEPGKVIISQQSKEIIWSKGDPTISFE
jgi:hypothetical protein